MRAHPERDVQEAIVAALRAAGCVVYQTTAWRQKGPSGVTPGIPDLLVRVPGMHHGHVIGIEVKRPGGKPSPAQSTAYAAGIIAAVVTSPTAAIEAILAALPCTVDETTRLRLRRVLVSLQ